MAEQVQTSEIVNTQLANKSIVSNIGNTLEKLKEFSNEPAIESIPVMITVYNFYRDGIISFLQRTIKNYIICFIAPEHEKSRVIDVLRSNGIDVSIDSTTGEILVPSQNIMKPK